MTQSRQRDAFNGWDGGRFKVEEMEADDRVETDAFNGWAEVDLKWRRQTCPG